MAPFVGLVMVFLTVAFVAWFNDVLVRSVSSALRVGVSSVLVSCIA